MLSPWGRQCSAEVAEDSQWWLDGLVVQQYAKSMGTTMQC